MTKSKVNGLFDQVKQMIHSSPVMKATAILAVLIAASTAAFAQTNESPNAREMSLEDCLQMTLQHNLDLQIDRYDPQIKLFALKAAYGAYDPALTLSGQHDRNESSPTVIGTNIFPGRISDINTFGSKLDGLSPSGTTYGFQGNVADSYGNFPEFTSGSALLTATQPLLKNFWIDQTRLTIRANKNHLKYSELQ